MSGRKVRYGCAALLCICLLGLCLLAVCTAAAQPAAAQDSVAKAEAARRANVPEGLWILISIHQKRLTLYEGTQVRAVYPVATGAAGTPSPIGTWVVNSRFAGSLGGFGTRFLGLNVPWGQFGIHGTNKPDSIGSNASHGCIRMFVKDSEILYAQIPNGTKVVVEGGPFGLLDTHLIPLAPGARGSHVVALQQRLRSLGYYYGNADGIYGAGTTQAVQAARRALGLPASEGADDRLYRNLGLILFE